MLNRFEQFSTMIASIYRDIQSIERDEMEKFGYKGAYAQYLIALRRSEDGLTPAEMCEICGKDKAAVSRALSEMEKSGLIVKEDGEKIYKARYKLLEKGKAAADFVCQKATSAVENVGKCISEEERTVMYSSLLQIASSLRQLSKDGIPENELRSTL